MANVHAEYMTDLEVQKIALPILKQRLERFGFQGVAIKEEEDFDGSSIFRMTARVQDKVPARILIDTLGAIHAALRKIGEGRFVYLSTERRTEDETDEDVE
jgi:hypothetical protein